MNSKYIRIPVNESFAIDKLFSFLYDSETIFQSSRYVTNDFFELVNELYEILSKKFRTERYGTSVNYLVDSETSYNTMKQLILVIYGLCSYKMKYSGSSAIKFFCIEMRDNMEQLIKYYIK